MLEESDLPSGGRGETLAALGVETATEEDAGVPDELPPAGSPGAGGHQDRRRG